MSGPPVVLAHGFAGSGRTTWADAGWLELLADEGLDTAAVPVGGELRSAAVVLERSGRVTVMNEPGPPLAAGDWERYERAVVARLGEHRVLACSGSTPPGTPEDGYARLVALANGKGVVAVVDANGPPLAAALAAEPDVVTPNIAEAEKLPRTSAEAREARALSYASLLLAAGKAGEWERALALWREEAGAPLPSRCLVAVTVDRERTLALAFGPDGQHASLRRLVCDLIEEYGRHTGHADLLRESVDGRTGEDPPAGWQPRVGRFRLGV